MLPMILKLLVLEMPSSQAMTNDAAQKRAAKAQW